MVNPYKSSTLPSESATIRAPLQGTRYSVAIVIVLGLLLPGLPTLLMRRNRSGNAWCIGLVAIVPISFVFFGPFWDAVLFANTSYDQFGFYPFVASCVLVLLASVWRGLLDRRLFDEEPDRNEAESAHLAS